MESAACAKHPSMWGSCAPWAMAHSANLKRGKDTRGCYLRLMNGHAAMTDPITGLVLTGVGARSAIDRCAQGHRADPAEAGIVAGNPFDVIAGTSAGAINAAALATRADDFDVAVAELVKVWANFHVGQIYRADLPGIIKTGARWLGMLMFGWLITALQRTRPQSLLDNSPLRSSLGRWVDPARINELMQQGCLRALAVTASSYGSGLHVTFYEAIEDIRPWTRSQRYAVRDAIGPEHLLASAAIRSCYGGSAAARGSHDIRRRFDGRRTHFTATISARSAS